MRENNCGALIFLHCNVKTSYSNDALTKYVMKIITAETKPSSSPKDIKGGTL